MDAIKIEGFTKNIRMSLLLITLALLCTRENYSPCWVLTVRVKQPRSKCSPA